MGKRNRRELESRLEVLVMHLLKWRYQPVRRSPSWRRTIREQRMALAVLLTYRPSLRPQVPTLLAEVYPHACAKALDETGLLPDALPPTCPWTVTQLLDDAFWPEDALQQPRTTTTP